MGAPSVTSLNREVTRKQVIGPAGVELHLSLIRACLSCGLCLRTPLSHRRAVDCGSGREDL